MLLDYHIHTNATEDGTASLLEIAEQAARMNIDEIAVTDHYIHGIRGYCVGAREVENHFAEAETAKQRYGVNVLIGLEVDYTSEWGKEIESFIRSFDFDIILGSAHFVGGYILPSESARGLFKKYPIGETYRMAMEKLRENIMTGLFDVMAHLDIVRRFGAEAGDVDFSEYEEQAALAADALVETGTGFEVNCRGYDHAPAEQYPSQKFLEILHSRGIDKVTVGSDAHALDKIGLYLDRGLGALRRAGFQRICRFSKRRPSFIDI
jgi:histidinol-phosphatase (PHP family)